MRITLGAAPARCRVGSVLRPVWPRDGSPHLPHPPKSVVQPEYRALTEVCKHKGLDRLEYHPPCRK